jgi:UPF0716 protein FxsA
MLLAWPVIEITLFVLVGGQIGVLLTLAVLIAIGVVGMALVRFQGAMAVRDLMSTARSGGNASTELARAGVIALAGLLLVIPGFFTDVVAVALLVPPVRRAVGARFARGFTGSAGTVTRVRVRQGPIVHDTTSTDLPVQDRTIEIAPPKPASTGGGESPQ